MLYRMLFMIVAVAVLSLPLSHSALAKPPKDEPEAPPAKDVSPKPPQGEPQAPAPREKGKLRARLLHQGKVVRIEDDKLVLITKDGKEFTLTLATTGVKVLVDGRAAKHENLKPGMRIRVLIPNAQEPTMFFITAQDKTEAHEGTVATITGNKLTMKDTSGKEHAHTVAIDAKVYINGEETNLQDLKPNMRIRVTILQDQPETALCIEVLSTEDGQSAPDAQ